MEWRILVHRNLNPNSARLLNEVWGHDVPILCRSPITTMKNQTFVFDFLKEYSESRNFRPLFSWRNSYLKKGWAVGTLCPAKSRIILKQKLQKIYFSYPTPNCDVWYSVSNSTTIFHVWYLEQTHSTGRNIFKPNFHRDIKEFPPLIKRIEVLRKWIILF